jgi:Helix-turn-helix domain
MESSKFWLTVPEAAQRVGLSSQWVRIRIRNKEVLALKRYGRYLVDARSLHKHVQRKLPLSTP